MKEKPFPKILGITQATGWVAVFDEGDGVISRYPVAVWAIVEDCGDASVIGMSQNNEIELFADNSVSNFLRWEPA